MGIKQRIYNDFFRPSKEQDYEKILRAASENGYNSLTLREFAGVVGGKVPHKVLVIRRDVDTADNKIQRKLLLLEIKYGCKCSSYFRNNTKNYKLMREIEDAGGEATYHYEEIATYCYKHRIRTKEVVLSHLDEIREMLINDIKDLRKNCGCPILTVSSHGEYVNRKINLDNRILINDEVREKSGIVMDAYDKEYISFFVRIHDHDKPNFVEDAIAAIERGEPFIELLTHPRQWNSPFWVNLLDDLNRVCKQLYMRL